MVFICTGQIGLRSSNFVAYRDASWEGDHSLPQFKDSCILMFNSNCIYIAEQSGYYIRLLRLIVMCHGRGRGRGRKEKITYHVTPNLSRCRE